jgi:hypothetical protein
MTIDELATLLAKPKRTSRGGLVALCPAHEDRERSLSVDAGRDGRILVRCFAACTAPEIAAALGLEMHDLFADDDGVEAILPARERLGQTRYEIRGVDGTLRAIHVRIPLGGGRKRYIWKRPDGADGLDGLAVEDLPLYNAHRLGEWPEDAMVLAVEGEKAADSLTAAGFCAVGTVTGAAGTPSREVLAALAGRAVVLWPDNDGPGRAHMERIAAILDDVAAVGIVDWPDAPPKGDAADFLATHSAADVANLIAAAHGWQADEPLAAGTSAKPVMPSLATDRSAPTSDWDTPITLSHSTELPGFPVASLPEWDRAFVEAEAEATQTPVDMAAVFSLAAIATIAASHVEVEPVDGWREPVNLFMACAMEPGSRKSVVHSDSTAPILEYERLLLEQTAFSISEAASIRRIAKAHLAAVEKQAASAKDNLQRMALEEEARVAANALERLDEPTPPRLFTDDATPEALATLLHENNGRMAVLSAEGGIYDLMAGRYSNGSPNLDVYLKGHAGDPLRVDRRGRKPEFVDRPALTVGVAVQPFTLVKAARVADFSGRGLFDRFLYAMPAGNVGYRKTTAAPVPADVRAAYNTNLRALASTLEHGLTTLRLTDEASAALTGWREELEPRRRPDGDLGSVQGWSSKLDGATVRIAGLLHLADTYTTGFEKPITGPTMVAAINIGRYFISHAIAVFDLMGADPHLGGARRILDWLAKGNRTMFTKRECHLTLRSHFKRAAELDPALTLLADHGWIRLLSGKHRPGRPSSVFEVNPALLSQNPQNARKSAS